MAGVGLSVVVLGADRVPALLATTCRAGQIREPRSEVIEELATDGTGELERHMVCD